MTDDQGRPWRWGQPLSRDEAEALARRWAEGGVISEVERYHRLKALIQEQVAAEIDKRGYAVLREVREYMAQKGLTEFQTESDPALVQQVLCEEVCLREVMALNLKGPDLDAAYWACMHQCAPVDYPETHDPDDPLYPHSDEPTGDDLTKTISLPERRKP